ncbi:MAG: glutaredoxin 2 [Gammaproteobacteria bacterium]|nr:glutaredoxin 2 [Gammaproteobacteria bacterium]
MKPTLYYYEHCPFCIRVLALAGLANIDLNKEILQNDDEKTPIAMTGVKALPILEYSPQQYMGESLDIVDYLCDKFAVDLEKNTDELNAVNQFLQDNRLLIYSLSMPRWAKMPFAEFATDEAIAYFVNKKTKTVGDFGQAIDNTSVYSKELIAVLEKHAPLFDTLVQKPNNLASIMLFAALFGVSCIKGFQWTASSENFMQTMAKLYNINLLTDKAV